MEQILINYHNGTSPALEKTNMGDGIDLYCAEETVLHAGEFTYISQGVSMILPEGYEAIVAPRSSTFKRYGILQTNGIGIIDSSYRGDDDIGKMPVYATRNITIPRGARICQFRIQKKQPEIEFISVQSLGAQNRGGFGSTGV